VIDFDYDSDYDSVVSENQPLEVHFDVNQPHFHGKGFAQAEDLLETEAKGNYETSVKENASEKV